MRPSCYIWFRIRLSARAFHNHIDLFLRGTRSPRVTYYGIITFCLTADPHVETPAFQWCCREERSTPEKCAGHIAEFERTWLLNHTFKARARARPFISAPRGPGLPQFCGMCRGEFGRLEEGLGLRASPFAFSVARLSCFCRHSIRTPRLLLWSDPLMRFGVHATHRSHDTTSHPDLYQLTTSET